MVVVFAVMVFLGYCIFIASLCSVSRKEDEYADKTYEEYKSKHENTK